MHLCIHTCSVQHCILLLSCFETHYCIMKSECLAFYLLTKGRFISKILLTRMHMYIEGYNKVMSPCVHDT